MNPDRARDMQQRAARGDTDPMDVIDATSYLGGGGGGGGGPPGGGGGGGGGGGSGGGGGGGGDSPGDEILLKAVARNDRFGSAGREIEVGINCFRASIDDMPDTVYHFNLDFYSERMEDPAVAGRGRGGRGRGGRGRGRGGRGGSSSGPKKPDEKVPPIKISTHLIERIQDERIVGEGGVQFPEGCKLAYDGAKNVYTNLEPSWKLAKFNVNDQGMKKIYTIQFRRSASPQIKELKEFLSRERREINDSALNTCDIVMRTLPLRNNILTGRSFSLPNLDQQSQMDKALGAGCEAWRGFYQALKPTLNGFSLFFDVSYSAFYKNQSLLDFAVDVLEKKGPGLTGGDLHASDNPFPDGFSERNFRVLKNELHGLRCENTMLTAGQRSSKIIDDLTTKPATEVMFKDEYREISIATHFYDQYGKRLKCPHLPCVQVAGKKGQPTYYPLECTVISAGQRRTKRMPSEMTNKMISVASRVPELRRKDILEMLDSAEHNEDPYMQAFGIKVDTQERKVKARVLPPPLIRFKGKELKLDSTEKELNWSMGSTATEGGDGVDVGSKKSRQLFKTRQLASWGVLVLADIKAATVQNFVKCLTVVCKSAGLDVAKPRYKFGYVKQVERNMESLASEISSDTGPCQMIMVVKENVDSSDYNLIKLIGDTIIGVPTQCVVGGYVIEPREMYCQNLMLKINAKLGGVNVQVARKSFAAHIGMEAWMVIGADLSHAPAADSKDSASVTACVGTMDSSCSTHVGRFRLQDSKTPTIKDLGSMVEELLVAFNTKNGFFPQKLLVYRDGVSYGQFNTVLSEEVNGIKETCDAVGKKHKIPGGYNPALTFIILQKRHHTRFFPLDKNEEDKSGNCKAGTVIDSDVVNARWYDFYLFSHNGIQGTSRPVRYTVLHDDNNMEPDDLQGLTYNMCFTYARCTRTVSVVPVAYYADLLASRGRSHLSALSYKNDRDGKKRIESMDVADSGRQPVVSEKLNDRLFYI